MRHIPVLLNEISIALNLASGKNIIDCTLGDGGHAEKILEQTAPNGGLLGIDVDPESLLRAKQHLYQYQNRTTFVRENFVHLKQIVESEKFGTVDGIIMDLGWSSPQFEERERGFSFQNVDEPLDMRYDPRLNCEHVVVNPPIALDGMPLYGRCTAAEIVNTASVSKLTEIFQKYGEESLSKEIAQSIIETQNDHVIETVGDLVEIILQTYRKKLKTDKEIPWIGGLHPATKVFQALRIAVNDELMVLENTIPDAIEVLDTGGRLAVITFHSIEDRIVKHLFKSYDGKTVKLVQKKPTVPSEEETKENSRSRSAKLRVVEKI